MNERGKTCVGRAVSRDLERWAIDDAPVLTDGTYSAAGSAIFVSQRERRLYYSFDTAQGFRLARSSDGRAWTPLVDTLLAPGQFGCTRIGLPFVFREGRRWLMVFEGIRDGRFSIFAAHSSDGLTWTPALNGDPLYTPPLGRWDCGGQANPSVSRHGFFQGRKHALFYNAHATGHPGEWDLGVVFTDDILSGRWELTPEPLLCRRELSWPAERLEGARFVYDDQNDVGRAMFFALPTKDSYSRGVIGQATLQWTERAADSNDGETIANDTLAARYFAIWDTAPIQKFTRSVENAWIKALLNRGDSVLLAGAGGGREIEALLGTARRVVAIDLSAGMLDIGRERFPQAEIEWLQGDIQRLPPDIGPFDHVFALGGVFAYLDRPFDALLSIRRTLAPGGSLTIAVMNADHPTERTGFASTANGRVRRPYSPELLEEVVSDAGFKVDTLRGYRFLVDLLPGEWNLRPDAAHKDVLEDLVDIEGRLLDIMPARAGKFVWLTASKPTTGPSRD